MKSGAEEGIFISLGAIISFCLFTRPYTSQDKGSVENRKVVIRRLYLKKTDFREVTAKDVKKVETMINNRPVRKLGYKTPNEVHLLKANVALIA